MFRDEIERCTTRHLLTTLVDKKPTLGDMFPNVMKLLCISETLIISTAAVERIFSKVKLIVTEHRNRLNVTTVNNLLMIAANTKSVDEINITDCVKLFLRKRRRICQN